MNVAFYIRSATGNRSQLAEQEVKLGMFAAKNSIHEWTVYEDNGSGFQELPAFTQMIEDANNGKIDLIFATNLNRISRDYSKLTDFLEAMPELNVRFIAVDDGIDSEKGNPIPSQKQDIVSLKKAFAELYIKELSKKAQARTTAKET